MGSANVTTKSGSSGAAPVLNTAARRNDTHSGENQRFDQSHRQTASEIESGHRERRRMKIRTKRDDQKDAKQYYHFIPSSCLAVGSLNQQSYHSAFRISSTRHEEARYNDPFYDAHFPGNQKLIADLNRDLDGETLVELLFSRQTYERPGGANREIRPLKNTGLNAISELQIQP
jgi:hypothetical protein